MKISLCLLFKLILIYSCDCFEDSLEHGRLSKPELVLIDNNFFPNHEFRNNVIRLIPFHKIKIINEICPGGVMGTIKALKLYPYADIVNLQVNDFYKFNYNDILNNNLSYGGEIDNTNNKTFDTFVIDMKSTDQYLQKPEVKSQMQRSVKIFSTRGIVDSSVYDYIQRFQINSATMRKLQVLICDENQYEVLDYINLIDAKDLEFTFGSKSSIQDFGYNLLAVLTPEQFEIDTDIPVPIVLYSSPPTNLNFSLHKDSISFVPTDSVKVFTLALIRFMQKVGWHRLAILSDNYENSLQLEKSLISAFDEHEVVYTVFRCVESSKGNCDFSMVLNTLKDADARIIIANIDDKNVQTLADQYACNSYCKYTWILRDGLRMNNNLYNIGEIIFIALTPVISNNMIFNVIENSATSTLNKFKIKSILESVIRVNDAFKDVTKDAHSQLTPKLYRKFTNALQKRWHTDTKMQVYFTKRIMNRKPIFLASMSFDHFEITNEKYELPENFKSDMQECLVRSGNFFKPCNDIETMFIMFVVVIFITTFIAILIFFTDINKIYGRSHYRNL